MGKVLSTELSVLLDDGTEVTASVDQRDYARWEAAPENVEGREMNTLRLRYLAWAALERTGKYEHGFTRFNTVDAVQVLAPSAEPEEEAAEEGKA